MQELVGFIRGYSKEISMLEDHIPLNRPMMKELWRPLDTGIIKKKFDASFQTHAQFSTVAVISRNEEGQIMGACSYPYFDVADAFVVEA